MNTPTDRTSGDPVQPPVPAPWRCAHAWLTPGWAALVLLCLWQLMSPPSAVASDEDAGLLPSVSSPLADPVVHGDAVFFARKVTAWHSGGASGDAAFMLLEGDVRFSLGVYGFHADRAVVRVDTETLPGKSVRHLSIYLDNAKPLRGESRVSAEATRLLVTVSILGAVVVENDLFIEQDHAPDHRLVADAQARVARHRLARTRVTLAAPSEPLFDPALFETRLAQRITPVPPAPPVAPPTPGPEPGEGPGLPTDQVVTQTEYVPIPDAGTKPSPIPTDPGLRPRPSSPDPGPGLDTVEAAAVPGPKVTAQAPVADDHVLPTKGLVSMNADRVVYDRGDDESTVMLIGNVRLLYEDFHQRREVSLRAQRVVVFLDEEATDGPMAPSSVDAGRVRGVYLEDNVIVVDADFTVRAPRVYYDVQQNRATLLEAVLYSYDATRQLPLYMRAQTVRQTSATSFEAEEVLLTTSEFAEPHFAIGAARITLDQEQIERANGDNPGSGGVTHKFTATGTTLQVRNTPLFYWPYLQGNPQEIPLKKVKVGYDSDNGPEIETTWDVFALAGRDRPDGVKLLGMADWVGDHGPAAGAELEYGMDDMFGRAEAYLLLDDNGEDTIGGRRDIEQDGGTRGFYHWQHRSFLENGSELSVESAFVSDETFLEEFFRDEANEAKQYETSIYWKMQEDDQALTFLTRYDLTDFTPQLTTLQTPGYTVDKAPEVAYYRTGSSFWKNRLTWFSENRAGFIRARPGEDTPFDRGFSGPASMTLFGIPNTTAFDTALFASGVPDEWVFRADSRQEISAPMQAGDVNVVPYAVGRITAYDESFTALAGEDEKVRLWGSLGVRATTSRHKTYDKQSRILDVHGIRHVVEPSVDLFVSGANIDSTDLPVYDTDVEGIHEGGGLRLGLTNTLQTKRGGPGRSRSVDWVVLKTDLVLRSDDSDVATDIAHFFEQRPEYSLGGDHLYTELLWMVTDTLGLAGELTHSLETDRVVQWRFGGTLQHNPRLSSYVRYDEIDILDSRLLSYGFTYLLTVKYEFGFAQRIDFARSQSRSINLWLERRLPKWRLRLTANVDEIENNQTIGIVLIPEGFGGGPSPLLR